MQRDATPQTRQGGEANAEPEQAELPEPPPVASYDTNQPRKKRRRSSRARYVDPGHLHGRIIAAERKAAKLEKGSAQERRQARAIRREVDRLKLRLEMQQEGHYSAEEAESWTPPAPQARDDEQEGQHAPQVTSDAPGAAPPSSSLSGLDWRYLEVLARAGEMRGIEIHWALCRADFAEVRAELVRRHPAFSIVIGNGFGERWQDGCQVLC